MPALPPGQAIARVKYSIISDMNKMQNIPDRFRPFYIVACVLIILAFAGCAAVQDVVDAPRAAVSWQELPGWEEDRHAEAIPAFLRGCLKLTQKQEWQGVCADAKELPLDNAKVRDFFERRFTPYQLLNQDGGDSGLITGYYEPLLNGSLSPSATYPYPVYARPDDLLTVDLGELYPQLRGRRVRGRVAEGAVVPYYSRAQIDGHAAPLAGQEILWVDDKHALFFLHIQGSGLVKLADGKIIGVGYRDQNGHPYRSIGRELIDRGEMQAAEVNLFSLQKWLKDHPDRADELLNRNPSYVFFSRRDQIDVGPVGSLGAVLTPERSLAVDPSVVTLGAPVWISTTVPGAQAAIQKLMFAQDTGGAIKGEVRADFFWGRGEHAEKMAGLMKERGKLFVLVPK